MAANAISSPAEPSTRSTSMNQELRAMIRECVLFGQPASPSNRIGLVLVRSSDLLRRSDHELGV